MSIVKLALYLLAAAFLPDALQAQPLRMVSEFRRVGANNQIIRADAVGDPREIISPAVLRGMHVSYRIVVATPPGMHYWMYVGANPEDVIDYAIYRERATGGVPNALDKMDVPVSGTVNAPRVADTYWVDLHIPPTTPARRIRFEAQLNFDNRWVIYPLEVRVMEGDLVAADPADATLTVPAGATSTAAAARAAYQRVLCPAPTQRPQRAPTAIASASTLPSQAAFLLRNAQQDLALVRSAEARRGHDAVTKGLIEILTGDPKATDARAFCVPSAKPYDPEIALRARDFLVRNSTPPNE